MAIYLGNEGRIQISRSAGNDAFLTTLENSDINVDRRRFNVVNGNLQFITGERIQISTLPVEDDIPLELVPGNVDGSGVIQNDFQGYIHVDEIGGIRLFKSLSDAINGSLNEAVPLGLFTTSGQDISIKVVPEFDRRSLGRVQQFSLTTSRQNIDTTTLSKDFRESYENGLIQGQGSMRVLWDFAEDCDDLSCPDAEFAEYLAKLCIRIKQGADFYGYFFLYYADSSAASTAGSLPDKKSVWYECSDCIITNVALTVTPAEVISAEVEFVTSGHIHLRHGYTPRFLEQEQSEDLLLNEDGNRIQVENPTD